MKPITVAILGFDGVAGLDLIGPLEAFAVAEVEAKKCYSTRIVGLTSRPFAAESGVVFRPHASLAEKIDIDTLIVPGGPRIAKTSDKHARRVLAFEARASNSPHRVRLHRNLRTGPNQFA
jgi:putative intracellular protease/amidase